MPPKLTARTLALPVVSFTGACLLLAYTRTSMMVARRVTQRNAGTNNTLKSYFGPNDRPSRFDGLRASMRSSDP
ncbi:hypothetical protein L228DRAFT_244555 [Xylona heveae TC161]|uniref:Uncharacterized protein n=1 Tax=Xylona heveae (strain CBS 132557 / TC161) TaxID=1328760 RepID=A0A165J361_XYLHT|nr:hypothetical protein L228DRAFT_244555 [Xylona heveae TC161]KZF25668.1 hypothetical protein L228DRAFT_244555 [Xylona heveae TC161]